MKKIILLLLLKFIYNFENKANYYCCIIKEGCENILFTLVGCDEELYSFKLNSAKCEEINGEINYYFSDNYI